MRDEAHRKVEVPPNLAGALTSARVKAAFEASFSSEQRQAVGALEA